MVELDPEALVTDDVRDVMMVPLVVPVELRCTAVMLDRVTAGCVYSYMVALAI